MSMGDINFCPNCGHDLSQYNNDEPTNNQLYLQALSIVEENNNARISLLQRKLRIGYGRAARFIEQMEEEGLVEQPEANGSRKIHTKLIQEKIAADKNQE